MFNFIKTSLDTNREIIRLKKENKKLTEELSYLILAAVYHIKCGQCEAKKMCLEANGKRACHKNLIEHYKLKAKKAGEGK